MRQAIVSVTREHRSSAGQWRRHVPDTYVYQTGIEPLDLAVADFNGDRAVGLAVANELNNRAGDKSYRVQRPPHVKHRF